MRKFLVGSIGFLLTILPCLRVSGWGHANYYGGGYGAAYHPPVAGVPYYGAYHPPVVVNSYSSGCYNCGEWAVAGAAVTGAVVGAAVASANTSAATANAYAAGVAVAVGMAPGYVTGEIVATLPAGCSNPIINGQNYYLCGDTWFTPSYGANGVYYRVVPTP